MTQKEYIRLIVMLVIGIIIGFAAGKIITRQSPNAIDTQQVSVSPEIQTTNQLIVKDQLAGNTVVVENVSFEKPGWVAIHDNVNGNPGRILGAVLFDKGQHAGAVQLLRATVAGTSYLAVLHTDDGDYKNFNPKTDTVISESGKPIMVQFTTLSSTGADASPTPTPVATEASSTHTFNLNLQ